MYPHEQHDPADRNQPMRRRSMGLWFYEQRGSRYYLRFTRLAVAVFFVPLMLSIISIAAIFFYQMNIPMEKPNINITVQPRPTYPPKTLIKPAPQLVPPPRVHSQQNVNANTPSVVSTTGRNVNEQ